MMTILAVERVVRALVVAAGEELPEVVEQGWTREEWAKRIGTRPFGPADDLLHAVVQVEGIDPMPAGTGRTDEVDDEGNLTITKQRTAGVRVTWRGPGARHAADVFEVFMEHELARRVMETRGLHPSEAGAIRLGYRETEAGPFSETAEITLDMTYGLRVTRNIGCIEAVPITIQRSGGGEASLTVGTPVPTP